MLVSDRFVHPDAGSYRAKKSRSKKLAAKKSHAGRSLRAAAIETLEPRRLLSANVVSYHGDAASTGQDLTETLLTPSNVSSTDFGRIFDTTLDGQLYAEPLAVANVNITRGSNQGIHNVIYAATMHDSLFAVDATTGQILWQDNFTQIGNPEVTTILSPSPTTGVTTVPVTTTENATNSSDVGPELGIISTPAINPSTNVIYLVADTQEFRNGSTPVASYATGVDYHFVQRLWAIKLSDGSVAISPNNPAIEPGSGGQVIGDTILDPTGTNTIPSFSSYTGYKYVAGPFVKGTGNNNSSAPDDDGWAVNTSDTTSPWGQLNETAAAGGYIAFNAILQMGRTAISLVNGNLYFGFASHGDDGPYYGWLLGYSASTLANTAAFITVPNFEPFSISGGNHANYTSQAGIWASGATITTDGTYLYLTTGNGAFNPTTSNFSATYTSTDGTHTIQLPMDGDYGDTVLKLAIDPNATQNGTQGSTYNPDVYDPNGYGLKVVDFFTPSNVYELNTMDEDIGSGGVLLIPSSVPGYSNPSGDQMLVTAGKEGRLYLLDAGNLGGYNTAYVSGGHETTADDPSPFDHVLGEYYYYESTHSTVLANNQTNKMYSTASYFNGNIYFTLGGTNEREIAVSSLISSNQPLTGSVYSTIAATSSLAFGPRGTGAMISANGTSNPIVWNVNVNQNTADDLLAYNPTTLVPYYDSQTNSSRDSLTNGGTIPGTSNTGATAVKFSLPTVFNGMVYVGTGGGSGTGGHAEGTLVGYGLLPAFAATTSNFNAPTSFTAAPTSTNSITLNWTSNSLLATEFEIDRSMNGGASTILAYVAQTGLSTYQYVDNTVTAGNQYTYKVRAISGGTMTLPATGGATTASTTAFATVNTGTFAVKSGSTLNVYLGAGGTVTLSATSGLTATQGSVSLTFGGITTINVTESASHDSLNVTSSPGAPLTFVNAGTSTLNLSGGTMTFAAMPGGSINLSALAISGSSTAVITATTTQQPTTLHLQTISIGAAAKLDMTNNIVIVNYPSTDPITTVAGYLKTGYSGGTWSGLGIDSSQANLRSASYGLGYADTTDPGNPAGLAAQTIEIKYTLLGDVNLDGAVNGVDFGIVAANFNKSITAWDQGDFNYDGIDNGVDFGFLSANFNKGANIGAAVTAGPTSSTTSTTTPPTTGQKPKTLSHKTRDHSH
jgi:hypothetical protein